MGTENHLHPNKDLFGCTRINFNSYVYPNKGLKIKLSFILIYFNTYKLKWI